MKSIVICFSLVLASLVSFLSLAWYVQFDHTQNTLEMIVKRSLMSTMTDYVDETDFTSEDVMNTFEMYFQELALRDYEYELVLSGFMEEPLFMRIQCVAENQTKLKGLKIHLDEAMIEELREDE